MTKTSFTSHNHARGDKKKHPARNGADAKIQKEHFISSKRTRLSFTENGDEAAHIDRQRR